MEWGGREREGVYFCPGPRCWVSRLDQCVQSVLLVARAAGRAVIGYEKASAYFRRACAFQGSLVLNRVDSVLSLQ